MKNILELSSWVRKIRIKGYGGTWSIVVLVFIYAYIGWPVNPWIPTESELFEVSGKAIYRHSPGSKSAVGLDYLEVDGLRLNCNFGHLGGQGGCGYVEGMLDTEKQAHAIYFWMSTRWGFRDRMLHSLVQDGRLLISTKKTFEDRVWSYNKNWDFYYQVLFFGGLLVAVLWFIERLNVKHNAARQL